MSRSADYTIQGFLYQFNKALLAILDSNPDDKITLEGIVEDVDIQTSSETTAIQCKYHESATQFAPSSIYKPLLQMMSHFQKNPQAPVRYILFVHYPGLKIAPRRFMLEQYVKDATESKNTELKKLAASIHGSVSIQRFLDRFSMEIGPCLDKLTEDACVALKKNGIPEEDIETIAYPNAINIIATVSTKHNPIERKVTKRAFLQNLKDIRKTAVSRWTLALKTRKKLLDARRKQLKTHLSINARLRCFIIDLKVIENLAERFVLFIKDYLDKYNFKPAHTLTPIFCLSCSPEIFNDIRYRLFQKGIKVADGYIGDRFEASYLLREPLCAKQKGEYKREFQLRLIRWEDHGSLLREQQCDDVFVIGDIDISSLNTIDQEIERISTSSLNELKFLMGVTDVCE